MLQDSTLEPVLYLLYIADLPVALDSTATYADDTAILAHNMNYIEISLQLQESFYHIHDG
jgi:hypothetical protein